MQYAQLFTAFFKLQAQSCIDTIQKDLQFS